MQAGQMDQQIVLQTLTTVRDPVYGQPVNSYTDFATVWAAVKFKNVGQPEPTIAGQQQSTLRALFRIRYLAGVLPTMRINHGGRFYQVLDWNVMGRNEGIHINAVEWNEGRR